jgi:sugar lactone lactonase YvrE
VRRWRSDPRRAAVVVIVGVLLLLVVGRLGARSLVPQRTAPTASSASAATAATLPPTTALAAIGKPVDASVGPRQLAFGFNSLWVVASNSNQVVRADPARGRATGLVSVEQPLGIATGFGAVWVTGYGRYPALLRLDPASLRVTVRIQIGAVAGMVAVGAGAVWVACQEGDGPSVQRVDPVSGRVTTRIRLSTAAGGCGLLDVAADGRFVWVEDETGSLWRIDAADNHVTRLAARLSWAGGRASGGLVAAAGMVWAASDLELLRLDQATGRVKLRLDDLGEGVHRPAGVVAVTPGAVWVAAQGKLARIDPGRNRLTGAIPGLVGVSSLVSSGGVLWAITPDGVVRVEAAQAS